MANAPSVPPPATGGDDIKSLLAGLSNAGGGTSNFIGISGGASDTSAVVEADQAAIAKWNRGETAVAYANGAQYLPVIQGWSPTDVRNLQQRMVRAGLLTADYQDGVWDTASQKAFTEVLGLANNMGHPWQDAMATYESGTPMQWNAKTNSYTPSTAGTARTNARTVTRFTSPDDLATTAQEVATAKLGRSFTPEELQKFIAAYHGTEQSASDAAATGQSFTSPASADVAAETFAKQADPNAYNAEQFLPLVQHMTNLLAGPSLPGATKPMSA